MAGNLTTEPTPGTVRREVTEGIATVTFGHPKGNSLPASLLTRLAEEISAAGQDSQARVILLQSDGTGAFCAGASFEEMASIRDLTTGTAFFSGFARVILAMIRAPKLVVARVHGKVVGGGVGMVAAADVVHAAGESSVRLSELALGIGPFVIGPVVERKIGPGNFGAMSADTEWRDAEWCERHGLYSRVHPDTESLDAAVEAVTRRLAGFSPDAMHRLKEVLWEDTGGWEEIMAERAEMSGRLVLSEFTREAIQRFRSR